MRLAFVDLEFSWPPPGGAQIHVVRDMVELRKLGHDAHLFAPTAANVWRFGHIDEEALPVPVTQLPFDYKPYPRREAVRRIREAVDAFKPDVVVLAFGFYLKAWLAEALAHYPVVSRYYTYEMLCPRDFWLYKDKTTCPNSYLDTPGECRRCFLEYWSPAMGSEDISPFAQEFVQSGGFTNRFHRFWLEHLRRLDGIVVTNDMTRDRIAAYNSNIHVVPGGVHAGDFEYTPVAERGAGERKVILMAGRADDPMKGHKFLQDACKKLWEQRQDFELCVTAVAPPNAQPFERFAGWCGQARLAALYREADICVVPSLWDEAFGLVAVEAMASGRPVCASRVGGLQNIVVEGETGFTFQRRNEAELIDCLTRLLDDGGLRRRMGDAGRVRAETEYDWPVVVGRYWPPILESVTS